QLPGLLTVNADSVLVTFTSDNNDITDYGFLLDYQVKNYNTSACMDKAISNQYYFVITDKRNSETSDDSPYRANATCRFNVSPPNYTNGYACNFRKFDLKTGDFIDIFDNTTTGTPRLLYRFDIENVPSGVFNIDVSKIYVQFVSDNWQEGTGFELESYIILGIDEESGLSDVNIYPNPASNYVNVKFSTDQAENISLQVLDMTGKMIYSEAINHAGGELNHQIPVANFAKGIYFLQLQTINGKTIHKFIVQ
ncbi:MAG: T9SS type A sorting domain-containing protein, partial [Bacteroidales bacterium]